MLILEENFRRHLEAFASELFIYIYLVDAFTQSDLQEYNKLFIIKRQ